MTLLSGLNHAAVITEDLDRFVAFYVDVFEATKIFEESTPDFRIAQLLVGPEVALAPVEMKASGYSRGLAAMGARGHIDHISLNSPTEEAFREARRRLVARGVSDGAIDDLGPVLSVWFTDPDGMAVELSWIRDPSLQGFHAPTPYEEPAPF
jgi:catechol 2,3-dioxygenase-like lactoylglutathione lyase family enzyme